MLELDDLRHRFGDVVALDGLSFRVPDGEMFGFVGPNGAGKTTAMRAVLGIVRPDVGTVTWRGRPIDAVARRRIGYMPEERGLYPKMRVTDQLVYLARLLGLPPDRARRNAAHLLEQLGLTDRARDAVEELSLGNQQRVQLAAALVHEPELLVLDEPFSGLDPIGVDVLSEVLAEQTRAGVAVVFSSHQLELVERLCDSLAIVRAGRVVASGSVEELRDRNGQRLRVRVEGAPAGWLDAVPGARPVSEDASGTLVELDDGLDSEALLDTARAAGRVTHFAYERPTVTDLFREVVA